jgi:hypothetical protein
MPSATYEVLNQPFALADTNLFTGDAALKRRRRARGRRLDGRDVSTTAAPGSFGRRWRPVAGAGEGALARTDRAIGQIAIRVSIAS